MVPCVTIDREWNAEHEAWILTSGPRLTLAEIGEMLEKQDWPPAGRVLWNLRELQAGPDSTGDLRRAAELVEQGRRLWGGSRVAIVVERNLDFGIARMFQAFSEGTGVTFEIFRDVDSGLAWLSDPSAPEGFAGREPDPSIP